MTTEELLRPAPLNVGPCKCVRSLSTASISRRSSRLPVSSGGCRSLQHVATIGREAPRWCDARPCPSPHPRANPAAPAKLLGNLLQFFPSPPQPGKSRNAETSPSEQLDCFCSSNRNLTALPHIDHHGPQRCSRGGGVSPEGDCCGTMRSADRNPNMLISGFPRAAEIP
jgi:hypothetical protein